MHVVCCRSVALQCRYTESPWQAEVKRLGCLAFLVGDVFNRLSSGLGGDQTMKIFASVDGFAHLRGQPELADYRLCKRYKLDHLEIAVVEHVTVGRHETSAN